MENYKWFISTAIGAIATFTRQYALILALVIVAITFDVGTGILKTKINNEVVNSNKGTKGFFKKVALIVSLFFGVFLDVALPQLLLAVSIELPFRTPFGLIMGCYIIFNEGISICENLYASEVYLPPFLVEFLKLGKDNVDKIKM